MDAPCGAGKRNESPPGREVLHGRTARIGQ
jgi:hypothetical protein